MYLSSGELSPLDKSTPSRKLDKLPLSKYLKYTKPLSFYPDPVPGSALGKSGAGSRSRTFPEDFF